MLSFEWSIVTDSAVLAPDGRPVTIAFARREAELAHQARVDKWQARRRAQQQERLQVPRPPQCKIHWIRGKVELSQGIWYSSSQYVTIRFVWDLVVEIMYRAEDAILAEAS